jgi:hypothetical protein
MFEQPWQSTRDTASAGVDTERWASVQDLMPVAPPDDDDPTWDELTDAEFELLVEGDCVVGSDEPAGVIGDWASDDDVRTVVRGAPVATVIDVLPADRVVAVLLREQPSVRVVAIATALLAIPRDRRSAWKPWVASELLTVWQRVQSWVASQVDQAIVDVAGASPLGSEDWGREEAAAALRLAPLAAAIVVQQARARRGRLRRVGASLADGTLLATQANGLVDALGDLDGVVADRVLDTVLPVAGSMTRNTLASLTRRAIAAADPDGAALRHETAKADRAVCLMPQPDGMVDLVARLTAPEGERLFRRIDAIARARLQAGDHLDFARADALLSLGDEPAGQSTRGVPVAFRRAHGRGVELRVTMTSATYLALANDPAMLDGYGPITAQAARELIGADAKLRVAITEADSGRLLHLSTASRLAAGRLAEHVITRDRVCRMVGCNRPAELCDLDHTVRHADGGPTCACNLAPLCGRHHRMKDEGGWQLVPRDGHLVWITPMGRRYDIWPEILDPTVFPEPGHVPACLGCLAHPVGPPTAAEARATTVVDGSPPPELPCPF